MDAHNEQRVCARHSKLYQQLGRAGFTEVSLPGNLPLSVCRCTTWWRRRKCSSNLGAAFDGGAAFGYRCENTRAILTDLYRRSRGEGFSGRR